MPIIVFGLIAVALGLWGLSVWWWSVVEALRGIIPILLTLIGLVALGAGVTNMREQTISEEIEDHPDAEELQDISDDMPVDPPPSQDK
ncbi:magnetosome protein MamI [Magnetococcales bacterium HHB-1]